MSKITPSPAVRNIVMGLRRGLSTWCLRANLEIGGYSQAVLAELQYVYRKFTRSI